MGELRKKLEGKGRGEFEGDGNGDGRDRGGDWDGKASEVSEWNCGRKLARRGSHL